MHLAKRTFLACLLALLAGGARAVDGNGLTLDPDSFNWPRWQGRLALGTSAGHTDRQTMRGAGSSTPSVAVMSDYYLTGSLLGVRRLGGFRATSGIVVGSGPQLWLSGAAAAPNTALGTDRRLFGQSPWWPTADAASDTAAAPYLGLGYTGVSARGGWSFNADLGLLSHSRNGGVKFGRASGGSQSLDDAVRDMRWSPLLQLGVSYSF